MNFLDKETGILGERIRILVKEQGMTIVSIFNSCWYGYRSSDRSSTRWS